MKSFLYFGVLIVALSNVTALTQEELDKIRAPMLKFIKECSAEYGVSDEQLKEIKESGNIVGVDPCHIGCVFKKSGFIDGDGKFLPDKIKEISKKYLSNEEDIEKFATVVDTCSAVNNEEVTGGDPSCIRSKIVLECYNKHRQELIKVSS